MASVKHSTSRKFGLMSDNKWLNFGLIVFILILLSCSDNKVRTEIRINSNHDTVNIDEPFIAYLHLDNYKNELPEFFIIGQRDTIGLVFNDTIKSAIFNATSHNSGTKIYNGFAQYTDSLGREKKDSFTITFLVR